jgi:hypothetical protein
MILLRQADDTIRVFIEFKTIFSIKENQNLEVIVLLLNMEIVLQYIQNLYLQEG